MHLRRAVLLFAIVLGLAAVAASVSREPEGESESGPREAPATANSPERAPTASPAPAAGVAERPLVFDASSKPRTRTLAEGSAGVVQVRVPSPGLVEIQGLGLSASADPLTPARFDVLAREPGRHPLRFTSAADGEGSRAGVLVIRALEPS